MRIAMVGVGGVGGYYGGRLAQAGEEVIFIARGAHLRAMQTGGLHIDSRAGSFTIKPATATDDPASVGTVDAVILGVKAWQVGEAVRAARPMIGASTMVVPLQNGVEAAGEAAAIVGREHVLGGLCHVVAFLSGPGRIRHEAGIEPNISFGELDNRRSDRVERLRDVFVRAGLKTMVPADITLAIWEKFLYIAAFGGVGAVTRAPIGHLVKMPETHTLLEETMWEVVRVANARGIALGADAVTGSMSRLAALAPSGTASMQRDIADGRPSELDSLNGAVVRLGAEAGVDTPLNRFIYGSLLPAERRARKKESPTGR